LDLQIQALTREIDRLSERITAATALLGADRQVLTESKPLLPKKSPEPLECQVEHETQTISILQDQMRRSRTIERSRSSCHEIRFCKDTIKEYKDAISEKMEEAVELQADVSCSKASMGSERAKRAEDLRRAEAWIEIDYKERGQAVANRRDLSAKINPTTLRAYERIRKKRGIAIAASEIEVCGPSQTRLRPKPLQDLGQTTQGIVTRDSSGLVIYRPEVSVDSVSAGPSATPTTSTAVKSSAVRTWVDRYSYDDDWHSYDDSDDYDDWHDYDDKVDSGYRDDWDYEE